MAGDVNYDFAVHVIGAGCICSNLLPFIARMGVTDISVYDHDTIEEHNRKNQNYRPSDVGRYKVEALKDIIAEATGVQIKPEVRKIEEDYFDSVVICGVDSMGARRTIWEKSIKLQPQIKLYIEARVGGTTLKVYAIDPIDLEAIELYEENLHVDPSVIRPECAAGELPTLAAVASVITGLIDKFAKGEALPRETIINISNWQVCTQ